jgi:hypothetical protein
MSFDTDKRTTIERKRFKEVWFVEELDSGKSMWTRVGDAFENKDGSYTITLRAVPLGKGKLNMRDVKTGHKVTDLCMCDECRYERSNSNDNSKDTER